MIEFLEPVLNLKDWMSPEHCTPDFWFRVFVIICGLYISGMYSFFAYVILTKLKVTLQILIQSHFGKYLGIVFILCAITHGLHSFSYINQYFKLGLLIFYPALVWYQTKLLISAKKAVDNIKTLRTHRSVILLQEENKRLKKIILKNESKNKKAK